MERGGPGGLQAVLASLPRECPRGTGIPNVWGVEPVDATTNPPGRPNPTRHIGGVTLDHVNAFTSGRPACRGLSRRWSPTRPRVRRTRCRRCRRATPPAARRPCADSPAGPAACPARRPGTPPSGSSWASSSSSSASVLTSARSRRRSPPAGKPLRYHETCLRNSLQPRSSPMCRASSSACRRIIAATSPRRGRVATGSAGERPPRGRGTATAGPGSRARRRRRRRRSARPSAAASDASQMSPLPSTGMSTCSTRRAIASQSAVPE